MEQRPDLGHHGGDGLDSSEEDPAVGGGPSVTNWLPRFSKENKRVRLVNLTWTWFWCCLLVEDV